MGGKYENVANAKDVQFADPTGAWDQQYGNLNNAIAAQQGTAGGAYDPQAYMDQFMGQQAGLANIAQGATSQLGQQLNAIAARNAALGSEAALAAMPGAANSGAGMAAFGQAYADPFAQAAAQTQAAQLNLTGNLWNQAMGANAQNQMYANQAYQNLLGMGQQAGMHTSGIVAPQYEYQKGFGDYMMDIGNMGVNLAGAVFNPLGAVTRGFNNASINRTPIDYGGNKLQRNGGY